MPDLNTAMKAWTDYNNFRTTRKDQIRQYIYATASPDPQVVQQQWRFLQAQVEQASAMDKQIEDLRQDMERGRLSVLDAAKRAEGSVNTAIVNAQGSLAVARTNAASDRETALIRAKSETIPRNLDAIQQGATEGSTNRFVQLSTTARNLQSRSAADVEAGLGVELDRLYVPIGASQTTSLAKTTFLADTADKVRQAALAAGRPAAEAESITENLMADKFGVSPASYTPSAVTQARQSEQAKLVAGLGSGAATPPAGSGPGQPTYNNTPSRAEQAGVDTPAAFEQLARRATYNQIVLNNPAGLQGRTMEQLAGNPEFESMVKEAVDTSSITDIQTYASPRMFDLLQQRKEAGQRIDTTRDSLAQLSQAKPDVRDLEDRATIAFVDLYGSKKAKEALAQTRTAADRLNVLSQVTRDKAVADAGLSATPEQVAALAKQYMQVALTPPPAAGVAKKVAKDMTPTDRAAYEADLASQQAERDFMTRMATQPAASTAQEVDYSTLQGLKSSGFRPTADTTGDLFGQVNGRDVRVAERPIPMDDTAAPKPKTPWIDPTLTDPGPIVPKVAEPELNFDSPVFDPNTFEFDKPAESDITQTPDTEPKPILAKPEIKKLVTEDKDLPWYARRSVSEDPVLQIPILLAGGKSLETMTPAEQTKFNGAIQRLNEDIRDTIDVLESEPMGSERKAEAGLHILDLQKVSALAEKAMKPAKSAQEVEERRLVVSADAGTQMAKKAVQGPVTDDPAQYLKATFGKNLLKPSDLSLVKDLARRKNPPSGMDLTTQLMRIAGNRWIQTPVREQLRSLYVSLVESKKAVAE